MLLISEGDPNYLQTTNKVLTVLGSIASILGLVITILVLMGVNKIKEAYVSKAIAPQRIDDLKEIRESCQNLLNGTFTTENKNRMTELLIEAKTSASSLSQKMKQINAKEYKKTISPKLTQFDQLCDQYMEKNDKGNARAALNTLLEIIKSSEFLLDDESWRRVE